MKTNVADRRPSTGAMHFDNPTGIWELNVKGLGVLRVRMVTADEETGRVEFRGAIEEQR